MASLVVEWIVETRDFDSLVRMLHGYRDGHSTDDIFRSALRAEPEAVDEQFDSWLRARANPDRAREFMQHFTEGRRQFTSGNLRQATEALEAAAAIFPTAGGGSPYVLIAQIHLREDNEEAAAAALTKLTQYDETAYTANLELARLLESTGDLPGAAAALERAVWIYPYELAPHVKLAELSTTLGDHQRAVRERRAILGLRPTDRADALYQLALALFDAGDLAGARTEVLRALEVAPMFDRAQQLLLRLHEGA
jgi:cellulose synthase operon protein C